MRVIEITEKGEWNRFVGSSSSPSAFLQSLEWGEFQKALGHKIFRLAAVGDDGEFLATLLAVKRQLHLGKSYLEIPKGPVWNVEYRISNIENELIKKIQEIGKNENAVLVRMNPPYESSIFHIPYSIFTLPQILLRQREPQDTVLVDLSKSEENLLANMHEKSRYNIRLAMKKGVQVTEETLDQNAFENFLTLIGETAKRDGIVVWPRARFDKFREFFLT